jgi:energy-coupling factor transport system permease protein
MTKTLSLYVERNTFIHRIDPINKVLYAGVVAAVIFILPYELVGALLILISILVLFAGKVFRKVIPLIEFSFIILLSIVIIQGLFHPGNRIPAFHIMRITFYKEGLLYAFNLSMRVVNILLAFAILVLTTKPSELIEALVRKGLSPRFGYVLSSALQIIPEMISTVDSIMDAQRSRGLETEGNIAVRIRAFFPLIGPVVMSSLIETRERAMALEVRAFNSKEKKTFLNERLTIRSDMVIRISLFLMLILSIILKVLL